MRLYYLAVYSMEVNHIVLITHKDFIFLMSSLEKYEVIISYCKV